jgi:tRNA modification GTPase
LEVAGMHEPGATNKNAGKDDLIVARATAPGAAAVAIVRLDGVGARQIAERLFRPSGGVGPVARPRRMVFGRWVAPASGGASGKAEGETLDEGMTVFFAAPRSYTGNDLAEFHCHGGPVPARRLVEAALAAGARLAEPGEFTRRAFLNGRMDLTQAEAVADLIAAQTDAAARLARSQMAGALGEAAREIRETLIALAAEIEARIDFPDEDLGEADRSRLAAMFAEAAAALDRLLATRRRGRLLREGARVAIVGRPNAGKSSLLNALARVERAIVTPHPGTTRDAIECMIDLAGAPVTLVDTAGLRATDDPVESIGVARARQEIDHADVVVEVIDATASGGADPPALVARRPDVAVWNKRDLMPENWSPPPETTDENLGMGTRPGAGTTTLAVSATRGDGLAALEAALVARLFGGEEKLGAPSPSPATHPGADALAIGLRHAELLERAAEALAEARRAFAENLSGELVMIDLREALDAVSVLLGLEVGDAILDAVFSRFCIGK